MLNNKTNTIILYFSSLISVVVGVGTSVLNTHSLSVADYGDVRYINNFMNFFSSIFLFGFFVSGSRLLAITTNSIKRRKINGAMIIMLSIASLSSVISLFLCSLGHNSQHLCSLFLYSLPVSFAPLLLNYVNNTFQGENRIINLSIARCLPSILYLFIAFVIYKYVHVTSVLMILLQNGILILVLVSCIIYTKPLFAGLKDVFKELFVENKRYGIHVYLGSVFAVGFSYLAGIFLGIFNSDNTDVGFYTLALTISNPLMILPSIVGTSYFKEFATSRTIKKKLLLVTAGFSFLSLILYIVLIYPVVIFLYDESYIPVAKIAIFLAFASVLHGLGDTFNRFLGAHGAGKCLRNGAFITGGILLIGNVMFIYLWGINGAILTRILSSLAYLLSMVYYYKKLNNNNL